MKFKKIIFIIIIALISDVFFIEPNMLILKEETLYLSNWNKQLNGYKIGAISDLHVGTHFVDLKKLNSVVEKINSKNPDLVVLLGDLDSVSIKSSGYSSQDIAKILSKLKSNDGIVSVLGNHDYEPNTLLIKNILKKSNITLLENEEKYIRHNGIYFRVFGFKDLWHHYLYPDKLIKPKNISTIALSHNPDVFAKMPQFVSLTLSGHTHGGEIYIPVFGAPFVPSKFGQKYRKGLVNENNKLLYVSSGVASLSRMRLFNPPEIYLFTIYSQE